MEKRNGNGRNSDKKGQNRRTDVNHKLVRHSERNSHDHFKKHRQNRSQFRCGWASPATSPCAIRQLVKPTAWTLL